jgi:hypothetical protein
LCLCHSRTGALTIDHLLPLWDALLIRHRYFAITIAVALLCSVRSRLLSADFSSAVTIVTNISGGIDIHVVIKDAINMWECTPSSLWPLDGPSSTASVEEDDTELTSSGGASEIVEWEPGKPARTPAELVAKMRWERRQQEQKRNLVANVAMPTVPRISIRNVLRLASLSQPSTVIVPPSRTQPLPCYIPPFSPFMTMTTRLSYELIIIDIRSMVEYNRAHLMMSTWIDPSPPPSSTRAASRTSGGLTNAVRSFTGTTSSSTTASMATSPTTPTNPTATTGGGGGGGAASLSLSNDPIEVIVNDVLKRVRSGVGAERRYIVVVGNDHDHQTEVTPSISFRLVFRSDGLIE